MKVRWSMRKKGLNRLGVFVGIVMFSVRVFGLQLAGVFTEGMVLQRDEPVRVWGTAEPDEDVTVQFAGQKKTATTGPDGKWMVTLDPMLASSESRTMVFRSSIGNLQSQIDNVLIGEVWLAGGQSNMQTTMGFYKKTTRPDIDSADDPMLRMITIPRSSAKWEITTTETVSRFSATAYYFAKNLKTILGVPVGIISCAVGGSPVEAWMSRSTMENNPLLNKTLKAFDAQTATTLEPYRRPCVLHDKFLTQAIPYTVRGVIWYQGERNANYPSAFQYRYAFSALINEWREEFQKPDLPFLFAQLATLGPSVTTPYWAELRDSQSWVEKQVPGTGMIVMVDGGEEKNIHPHSKPLVGYRLSLLARNMVYGEINLVCRGPTLVKAECTGDAITLMFSNIGSGLVLKESDESAFEICGDDGNFVPAEAKLQDGKIIVFAESVAEPKYVRYGWKQWFVPSLYNQEGLPASPFRTDDFPFVTEGRYYLDGKS